MENKVWNILDKEIWTEEGQIEIEQLHDSIARMFEKVDKNDMRIFAVRYFRKFFRKRDMD